MDRRIFTRTLAGAAAAGLLGRPAAAAPQDRWSARLAALEARAGGNLGAWILDPATGRGFGWRGAERFAQCSTFKLSLAACALQRIDRGLLRADERLAYGPGDLLPNSPVTAAHVGEGGMTVAALIEAAQKTSDNGAANLVLRRLGGPAALTAFWRALGDRTSRLDRYETALNHVPRHDSRDTVTPRGIAQTAARFAAGSVLSPASRGQLQRWMEETETGARRIRAGLPTGWRGGDKTGTASYPDLPTMVNDIALCWPPGARGPIVVAAFYRTARPQDSVGPRDEAVLARVGAIAAKWWSARAA